MAALLDFIKMVLAQPEITQPARGRQEVYALYIDMIGSTKFRLSLNSYQLMEFDTAFVEQIGRYIARLQIEDAVIKFTGDGWLLMKPGANAIASFSSLALAMASNFC